MLEDVERSYLNSVGRPLRSVLSQFAWYGNRLAAMSAAEIVHRVVETANKQTARRHYGGWDAVEPSGPLGMMHGLRPRILGSSSDLSALIMREADKIRAGDFCLLGARW